MKIKVIDLLNSVYEKKAPARILYKFCEYEFNKDENDYKNTDGLFLFEYLFKFEKKALFLEVEIIEEKPKKIKLLEIEYENKTTNNCYIKNENGTKCFLTKHSKMIAEKLNELTKTVNCLLEKSDKDEC